MVGLCGATREGGGAKGGGVDEAAAYCTEGGGVEVSKEECTGWGMVEWCRGSVGQAMHGAMLELVEGGIWKGSAKREGVLCDEEEMCRCWMGVVAREMEESV